MSNSKIKIYGQLESGVLNGYLTELSQIKDYDKLFSGVEYKNGEIIFKNKEGNEVVSLSAAPFIKDGMLSSVSIVDGSLVFRFNTDSGQSDISVSLSDVFTPGNYYTKEELDNREIVRSFKGFTDNVVETGSGETQPGVAVYYSRTSKTFGYGVEGRIFSNWNGVSEYCKVENGASVPLQGFLFYDETGKKTYFYDGTDLVPLVEKDEDIAELMAEVFPLGLSVTTSASVIEFDGNEKDVTLTVSTTRKGASVVADTVVVNPGNGEETITIKPTQSKITQNLTYSELGRSTVSVEASYGGLTKSATKTVELILPIYAGFGFIEKPLSEIITMASVQKYVAKNLSSVTTIANPNDGGNMIIALPSNLTLKKLTSNGFDMAYSSKTDTITIGTGTYDYNVYYTDTLVGDVEKLVITI